MMFKFQRFKLATCIPSCFVGARFPSQSPVVGCDLEATIEPDDPLCNTHVRIFKWITVWLSEEQKKILCFNNAEVVMVFYWRKSYE